jgi:hypothetical protein
MLHEYEPHEGLLAVIIIIISITAFRNESDVLRLEKTVSQHFAAGIGNG